MSAFDAGFFSGLIVAFLIVGSAIGFYNYFRYRP